MITAYQELATVYVIMGANIKVVGIKRVVPFPRELVDQKSLIGDSPLLASVLLSFFSGTTHLGDDWRVHGL